MRTARCIEFDMETDHEMPVNADGEIVSSTPTHFKVLPDAIEVFAPKTGAETRTGAKGARPLFQIGADQPLTAFLAGA